MNRHIDFDQLQDYREGLLSPEEHEKIRAHLEECGSCSEDLAGLSDLMKELAELPEEATPARDLWPQIEWRIGGSEVAREGRPSRQSVTMPLWQLLAASIAVALVSGGAVWTFLAESPQAGGPIMTGPATMALPAGLDAGYEEYERAALELEGILLEAQGILDPETIQVLEGNLMVIDEAIAESKAALSEDPGSRILRRILSDTMRRKVGLLQQAAVAIYANS